MFSPLIWYEGLSIRRSFILTAMRLYKTLKLIVYWLFLNYYYSEGLPSFPYIYNPQILSKGKRKRWQKDDEVQKNDQNFKKILRLTLHLLEN